MFFYLICCFSLFSTQGNKNFYIPRISRTQITKKIFLYWLHNLPHLTVSLSQGSYTSLFQHVKLCLAIYYKWNQWYTILLLTQICKFVEWNLLLALYFCATRSWSPCLYFFKCCFTTNPEHCCSLCHPGIEIWSYYSYLSTTSLAAGLLSDCV